MAEIYSYLNALENKAVSKSESGKFQDSVYLYHRLIQIDPRNTAWFFGKALAHQNLKDYRKAIHYYQKVHRIEPECTSTWNNSGNCYMALGFEKAAIRRYKKAIEIQTLKKFSTPTRSFYNLIAHYARNALWNDALLVVDLWIRLFPEWVEAHEIRAEILIDGDFSNLKQLRTRTGFEFKMGMHGG